MPFLLSVRLRVLVSHVHPHHMFVHQATRAASLSLNSCELFSIDLLSYLNSTQSITNIYEPGQLAIRGLQIWGVPSAAW